jgi:SAM-dependent methyltransferase
MSRAPDVPHFDDPQDALRAKECFAERGFTDAEVLATLQLSELGELKEGDIAGLVERTSGGSPLETLIRLFLIGTRVAPAAAAEALAPLDLATWVAAGLVDAEPQGVRGRFRIQPYHRDLLVHDRPELARADHDTAYVMGIGKSTQLLSTVAVRRPVKRALDLGTGCGTLAFDAAAHAGEVVGSDPNPRAIGLARFNAAINARTNVSFREGSLFEPVARERFGLIVSNPPFVISPTKTFIYRDGGEDGDGLVERLVRSAGDHLEEGGYCQLLCNWIHRDDEPWEERLARWVEGTGCDAWVLCSETRDPGTYARTWIGHTEGDDPARLAEQYEIWMASFERQKVTAVSAGIFNLRRRDASRHWFRGAPAPPRLLGDAGASIERCFAARDFLDGLESEADLLDVPVHPSPDLELEERRRIGDGGWRSVDSQLRLVRGLAYEGPSDALVSNLLAGVARGGPLRPGIARAAADLGLADAELAQAAAPIARRMLEQGMLRLGLPEADPD